MPLSVRVAHDPSCSWCWIGLSQVRRLQAEFDVTFEWVGYELWPIELEYPDSPLAAPPPPNKPKTPSRYALALAAEGLDPIPPTPAKLRTFRTHRAIEFARDHGVHDALLSRVYKALWQQGLNVNEPAVLMFLARGLGLDETAFAAALEDPAYQARVVPFDDVANSQGVYGVPTFWIDGERYTEQPYRVLREALARVAESKKAGPVYEGLNFPLPRSDRPGVIMNMVATIDGKIVTGDRNEPVQDLGSARDHATMRYLQTLADAVLVGAGNVRATPKMWYPKHLIRLVATQSGEVPTCGRFFTDAPDRAYVVGAKTMKAPADTQTLVFGADETDWRAVLQHLRTELGVQHLLLEGGSELNASLLNLGVVDEIFMTLAPKVKLGKEVPTLAGGDALPRDELQNYTLVQHQAVDDEVFLRYRRKDA